MLDERKLKAIETLLKGENVSDTAKICGISRQSLYKWMDDEEFQAELNRQVTEIKTQGQKKIDAKVVSYIDELEKIALTSKSEKIKIDALIYLINRTLGTPTNKVADVTEEPINDKVDKEDLQQEFTKFKVIKNAQ